ncbi:retinitis pigmentosa 9 protein-like isoform X3 [Pan paniscus]|uniref:retinitis pigmentosa 9 protein-like isoform X3 n=1 Tax=Pan paniscus TaxID=9597 RepID=UPI001561120D|nr:retinitis pigmentosa 9 protein-like isoform X2 [Pan paniscus]
MSSWPGREDARAGGAWWPRELPDQELQRAREQKRRRHDAQQLQQLKHLESFYEKPPPGLIKAHEDFMYDIIRDNKQHEKNVRIQQLKQLLEDSTSDEDRSSSSSSEGKEKHKKKKKKEKHKKRKKEKKKKKKRKHKSSKSNEGSDSE